MKTQMEMFWQSHRKISDGNMAFMDMVKSGDMDRATLTKLIAKRPEVYGRFSNWLDILN